MARLKFACLAMITMVFICGGALAKVSPAPVADNYGLFFHPYIGADYQYVGANYQDIPGTSFDYGDFVSDSFHGVHAHIGARIHKNLGFEAGYLWTADSEKTNLGVTTKANVEGFTFDGLGYIPVNNAGTFELIGTAGVSYLTADVKVTAGALAGASDESEFGFRVGGGAQYWLTDSTNARGLIRYQTADFKGILEDAILVNAGVNFQFNSPL